MTARKAAPTPAPIGLYVGANSQAVSEARQTILAILSANCSVTHTTISNCNFDMEQP